jgi:hypothetical protein
MYIMSNHHIIGELNKNKSLKVKIIEKHSSLIIILHTNLTYKVFIPVNVCAGEIFFIICLWRFQYLVI